MVSALHVSPVLLWMAVVAMIFVIAYPLLVAGIVHKKLRIGWKYFWFGVLVFLVSQLLTRFPLTTFLSRTVFASLLRTSPAFDWIWLVILAVTAGLFEEIGRYLGYRIFMGREVKTWSKAVMFGVGHESLEAIVLVGGQIAFSLLSIVLLSSINLNSLPLEQRQSIIQQLAATNAQPVWLPLQAAWGRLWSVPLQVALSVLVLQVFRRHQERWLFLAILFHALIDFLTGAIPQVFGPNATSDLLVAGMLCVFGLLGLWIIWHVRESDDHAHTEKVIASL